MADMEIVRQFNSELSTLYATKPPISKAKVTSITRLALKAVKYYKHVVQSLEKFVQKCRPEYKIPALYVIDSIIRQSRHQFGAEKDVFGPRFGRNITNSFQNFFKCLPEEQSKLIKVLNLWQKNKVYTPEVIQPLLNMAHTRPMTEQQGSPKMDENVKAVPADTTQPVVGHMAQHHATQQPGAVETPQEQAYIALLQHQQEEQMRHIRELEARLQRQQQMNQQLQQGQSPPGTEAASDEQSGEPKFQLPTEVFAQIQALASMVNQPGGNPPESYNSEQYSGGGGNYDSSNHPGNYAGGNPPDDYGQQYDQHQYGEQPVTDQNYQYMQGYEEGQHDYMGSQHQGFVDDFDYGDDQDDQQRMEEKKRQLEQEANRLKTASSYEQNKGINARQHLEEQYRQQQQMVSDIPAQAVPESKPVIPETLHPSSESAISAFQPAFSAAVKPSRDRSRSPRERRHRDSEREYRDSASDRERERGRERQADGSDRNRQRNRGDREDRDRTREDRDRARDRTREKGRGDRDERETRRDERDRSRDERERTRDGREKSREKSRENRDERERTRDERERTRERERGRESDKETRVKEEQSAEEKKEVKIEKWVPPVKEGHVSVCSRTVWLGRMHRNTTKETLQELFQEFGDVQIIDMVPPRGCAYIQMAEREAAYHSLSSKQIVKQNYKLAWAPAKGAKEYKEHFDKELGVTYIPVAKLQESEDTISSLAEGGWIDPRTIPEDLVKKEEAAAAASATGQVPGVLGMPLGPPPFGMPPGAGVPPGMPRLPFGIPGLPLPGMMPPGMPPGMPGMQFPQGMGNMPFPRLPMNNRLPFMPGVNPFMMPGLLPGMQPGAPMPGMPPFFRGPPPSMGGQPPANAPAEAGQPQNGNQGEAAGQSNEANQEGATETQGENAPVTQGSTESGFQGAPPDQGEGQSVPNNSQETQGSEQFGVPAMGQGGGPPFQGGPPFHGGPGAPPFQPQFGQGQPPFHGDPRFQGPPQFNDQSGGPPGPWRPAGPDNHWRPEGRRWSQDDGPPNEDWGNEREHWGHEGEHWRHDDRWGRGNDRRGRRDRHSQDEWGREEHFDRRKRGRFDDDWGPPHDRHQGPPHDRHRGRPPFGRDHPPRFGPGRGPPFPMDGPPPFDERRPWMRDEQRGRWSGEDRPFRGDPMEQQPEAEQQAGFEGEQKAGDQTGRDPDAPLDNRHGDSSRDIPSLMGGQFKPSSDAPGEDSGVPENAASQEEVAKGWAEINALKARIAMNKNPGAAPEKSETGTAHAEGQAGVGDSNEQKIADVKPDVSSIAAKEMLSEGQSDTPDIEPQTSATVAPVERSADSSSQSGQDNVLESQVKVKVEPPEEGDLTRIAGEYLGAPGHTNVDVPVPIIKDEPMSTDEVSDKPDQESSAVAPLVSSSQDETMAADKVLDHPKDERFVALPEARSSQDAVDVSEPGVQVIDTGMEQNETVAKDSDPAVESSVAEHMGDNLGSEEVNGGSECVVKGSEDVCMGSEDVGMGTEDVGRGSEDAGRGREDISRGSEEAKLRSVEVKVESSEEVTKPSEEVNMGSEEVRMGSGHDNMESGEVNEGPGLASMKSEISSDQVDVGSMETTRPENVESGVAETPSQLEASTKSIETNAESARSIEEKSIESEAIERSAEPVGSSMGDEVPDSEKKSDTVVQQEADTTSDVPPGTDQIVADPTDCNVPESTEVPGDA